jgi:hypothetical protein
MANRRFIDFPVATTVGANDIILIWQDGLNKQTTKATILSGLPEDLEDLADVNISGLTNGQILRYDSTTGKWENTDQGNLDLNDLNDVSIVSPSNGQVLVYNSSTSKWENSSGGFVPYVGAVTTVDLGAQGLRAGYVRFNTSVVSVPDEQGLMYWDADDETVAVILNGTIMKIGEDQFYPVKNQTGSTIAKGTAVRFAGTVGASGRLLIAPFIADNSVPSSRFMGVTSEAILNGADGKVMWFGRIRGINTNAFNEGDILYASTTTAGGFQTAIPVAPNNIVQVAAVVTKSTNNGTIFVRPTLGSNINKDEGVKIVSPTTGQLLQLQSNGLWENKTKAQVLGGTSSQFVKGDGSLDSTAYVPTSREVIAGAGLTGGGALTGNVTLAHADTSSQASVDNSNGNVIQDVTLDTYGHITALASTNLDNRYYTETEIDSTLTNYQLRSEKAQPNGYASLDSNGKVPLVQINDALIGNVNFQGLWNASTNTPTLANPPASGTKGYYYIVSTAGTFAGISFEVGDWIISNGTAWGKVDNTDAVSSVFGRTGNVTATNGDYNTSQVTENTNLYYTEARVSANTNVAANTAARHNAVTLGTANGLSLSTQVLSLQLATSGQNGALSSTDWTTFNNKENAITAGTTAQYFRGDKTFQTLNTGAVPESGNLYFTNARAIASVLTGYSSGAGTISAADSILSAIQKLNGNIGALVTGVSSVNGQTGVVVLTTSNIAEGTNLYYTEARVNANTNVAANTAARHAAVTLGTANGLSLSTQQLSLGLASAGVTGALSGTDWSTFNSKQQALNGTGFVKISGTTISYDNSTYLTTAAAASTYLPLAGGTMTGNVNWAQTDRGITWAFNTDGASIKFYNTEDGDTNSRLEFATIDNNDEFFRWVHIPSGGSLYESMRLVPNSNGNAQLIVSGSIIKSGGTSAQFLKADGSVDSNTYLTTSAASSTYLPLTGGTLTGALGGTSASFSSSISAYNGNIQLESVGTNNSWVANNFYYDGSFKYKANGFATALYFDGPDFEIRTAISGTANSIITWLVPFRINNVSGATTFESTITATSIIRTGGTSAQFLKADGSVDSNSYYLASNPSAFIALTALSGTAPIQYNNTTGAISITQASGSTNGFLSSTDWTTFNNKTSNVGTVTSVAALTLGTSGTDLSSSVANSTTTPVITLNVPTASAANRGALSAADWTTFNNKQNALTNPVTGTGTTNFLPKFTGASTIGNSLVFDNGTNVGVNTTSPDGKLDIAQAMSDGSTSAFTSPHLALTATSAINNTGFVGITFATSDSVNYGFSYGALRSEGGLGDLVWRNHFNSAQGTQLMRLTYNGNLGLGVTPSAWVSSAIAFEFGTKGEIATNGDFVSIGNNRYINTSGQNIYKTTDFATTLVQIDGQFQFYTAPSGTAGNAITFTQAMTLGSNSGLSIGTPSAAPSQGLLVQGNVGFGATPTTKLEVTSSDLNNIFVTNPDTSGATTGSGIGFKAFNGTAVAQAAGIILTSNTWSFGTYSPNQLSIGSDGSGGLALRSANAAPITFFTGGTTAGLSTLRLTIASTGAATFSSSVTAAQGIINGLGGSRYQMLQLTAGGTSDEGLFITTTGTGNDFYAIKVATGANANAFAVTNAGNIGIGTTSPIRTLSLESSDIWLSLKRTSNREYLIGSGNQDSFRIQDATAGFDRFTIASTGAATFSSTLDAIDSIKVTNNNTSFFSSSRFQLAAHNGTSVVVGGIIFQTSSASIYGEILGNQTNIYGAAANGIRMATATAPIIFATGNADADFSTARLTINSGGNVLIGTTTDNSNRLRVNGSIWADGNILMDSSVNRFVGFGTGNSNAHISFLSTNTLSLNSSSGGLIQFNINGNQIGRFNSVEVFANSVLTSAPYGTTARSWKLGRYITETTSADGSIRVEIDGRYYNIAAQDLGVVPS